MRRVITRMFPDRLKVLTVNPSGKPGKEGRGKREREREGELEERV